MASNRSKILYLFAFIFGWIGLHAEVPLLSDREPLPKLIEALSSEDLQTRQRAVEYIGGRGSEGKDAVPALIAMIERDEMATSAIRALGRIGPAADSAIPVIFNGLKKQDTRWNATEALVKIGEASIPTLLEGTKSENKNAQVSSHVALAMMQGQGSEHFQFLVNQLASSDGSAPKMERALRGLAMLSPLPEDMVPLLIECLDRPEAAEYSQWGEIIWLIARTGSATDEVVALLIGYLDHENRMARLRSIQAIHELGGARFAAAVPRLLLYLADNQEFYRGAAAEALGAIGPEARSAIPQLAHAMKDDAFGRVGIYAAIALDEIAPTDPRVQAAVMEVIRGEDQTRAWNIARYLAFRSNQPAEWLLAFNILAKEGKIDAETLWILQRRANPDERSVFPDGQFDDG